MKRTPATKGSKTLSLRSRPQLRAGLVLPLILAQLACLTPSKRTPNLEQIFSPARARRGKRPIVVIPGILGSELVNRKTGALVWPRFLGSSRNRLTLPLSPDLAANRDDLYPGKIVEALEFGRLLPEVYVYRGLLDALRMYGGYREGNWDNPAVDGDKDTFYVFAYDWRRDNSETARELFRRLQSLKQKLNRPDLRFNIIAHSMGGLIARYTAMYGDADLPASGPPALTWAGAAHIQRILMLGVPNEGSMDAFATILRGYSLNYGLRAKLRLFSTLSKELAFSSPSVFELLPHKSSARFLDENLQPMSIDLYDPSVWNEYGWSLTESTSSRDQPASDNQVVAAAPNATDRDGYLSAVLRRARQFHEALDVAAGDSPVAFFSFAADCEPTLNAPVILRDQKRNRWLTLTEPREFHTTSGRNVSRREAIAAMYVPGDGRVTRRSVLSEDLTGNGRGSLFGSGLPLAYVVFACDVHGSLPNNKTLQDNELTAVVNEVIR